MRSWPVATSLLLCALACSSSRMGTDGGGGAAGGDAGNSDAEIGNDSRDAHARPLCDGEQHLRLWVLLGGGGSELAGSYVRTENGSPVLTVDGTCAYWVSGGWSEDALSRDRSVHTGRLSDADISALEESVPLEDLTALADCPPPPAGAFDYSTREIRTTMATVDCRGTAGPRFDAAWATVNTIATRLWDSGTPVEGALHVSAIGPVSLPPTTTSPPAYAWPLAQPLGSFVLDGADWSKTGVSRLVDDPAAAAQLRATRDKYLTDRATQPGLYSNWDGLIATDQITTALVYMRDAIPYEDARGLLKF